MGERIGNLLGVDEWQGEAAHHTKAKGCLESGGLLRWSTKEVYDECSATKNGGYYNWRGDYN